MSEASVTRTEIGCHHRSLKQVQSHIDNPQMVLSLEVVSKTSIPFYLRERGLEVHHDDDLPAQKLSLRVVGLDPTDTLLYPERAEVDLQLVHRVSRLRNVVNLDNPADPHLELVEFSE